MKRSVLTFACLGLMLLSPNAFSKCEKEKAAACATVNSNSGCYDEELNQSPQQLQMNLQMYEQYLRLYEQIGNNSGITANQRPEFIARSALMRCWLAGKDHIVTSQSGTGHGSTASTGGEKPGTNKATGSAGNSSAIVATAASRQADRSSSVEGVSATGCLMLTTDNGRNAIKNLCSTKVWFAFCGIDARVNEPVGVCGRDIGGDELQPGQVHGLTQGLSRTRYAYLACFNPYTPMDVKWTGGTLVGRCVHI